MKRLFFLFILSALFCFEIGEAQQQNNIEHSLQSSVFNKERRVRVHLPDRYFRDSTTTYPVVYVLDAQSNSFWNIAKGNIGYLANNYAIMPMIVVGIVSDNRGSDFNPPATNLQNHFRNEVFPLIEKNYRTDGYRAIIGHSWGGAFVGTTLFSENNDLFDGYIGISPSFGDEDNIIIKDAARMLKNGESFKKYLYFSNGDVGRREKEFEGYVKDIDSLLKVYPNKTLVYQPRLIERVDHWQIVGPSFCDGLISLSRNYFADQKVMEDLAKNTELDLKTQIKNFNATTKEKFGYVHKASSGYLNFVANDFRDMDDYKTALVIYGLALEKSPKDVKVYVNMFDLYDKMGDHKTAKPMLVSTIALLKEQKENVSEAYYRDVLKWLQEKLEGYN
ncbi:alpha/beta hydrolase-fold protein [Ichthyenterobacterium sp. W332]|uniref:Alpha/beta hydrolase-fold protein n=1 Tax=Microcosmobacter mediterraneus TaxID=3075607 RepID=A0ABU2YGV1_9FLAO|nr:alpha/beta hydrolase-fold protein [Ichthyenterobacterium sp. W332]MDT0557262.1 alpha/beta hydrolase-fold protein [Ichthyenterobacterium sp. W332]